MDFSRRDLPALSGLTLAGTALTPSARSTPRRPSAAER